MASPQTSRRDFKSWTSIDVRWGDMDALGHVNNAAYFTFCESARIRYFEAVVPGDFTHASEGPTLAHAAVDFRRQVLYQARLEVGVRVSEIRNRSFRMDYGIFLEGTDTVVAEGTSVVVWADYRAGKATELPAEVRRRIEEVEA